ncbi:probable glutathione S-transferase [Punica granatum]|uniref:Probable glutathione S-transferase n=1 Tax=Punica granatum TaxID=22663 RepID=A0A6P8DQN4_PUNGR|nr:probable glutathione S-transferase [Punica granatum]
MAEPCCIRTCKGSFNQEYRCLLVSWKAAWSDGEEREKLKEEVRDHLRTLNLQLKDKKFFGGDSVGFLDISANYMAYWIIIIQEVTGVDLFVEDKFPTMWKLAEEFRCYPLIKDNRPEEERLFALFKAHSKSLMNASK